MTVSISDANINYLHHLETTNYLIELTRINRRRTIVDQPRLASNALMVIKLSKKPRQISRKEIPDMLMPNKPFNCVDTTVKAAAEQNPDITGAEMISMMNPV